ncbi:hypothetical protein [Enterobacter cloacae]|uniref:hypothetical protein n=1 Tax=Enterobacter cloacae TaxID=550 RepID=UPI002A8373E7|nr:hypothetical protein [Enterobacter cloacae]
MKHKYEFIFDFHKGGIIGTEVTITRMVKSHWWNEWRVDEFSRAVCTGFNPFTGAQWSGDLYPRLDVGLEIQINDAAQKAARK